MIVPSVLLTGGAGFIGANLVRVLLDSGYKVTILDNFAAGQKDYLLGLPIEVVEGDILDTELVHRVVQRRVGVVHLAAQTGVPGSLEAPRRDCQLNVIGTLNMLEACRAEKERSGHSAGPRFVFASSNASLGRQKTPAREDKAPLPVSPYGASKLAGEGYCLAYHGCWGLQTVALRFANVYGPFSAHKSSVVAKFFKDSVAKNALSIEGDGAQTRDFVHVHDLCRAIVLALKGKVAGEIYQVATGIETSINSLAHLIREVTGRNLKLEAAPGRPGDVRKNYSMIAKAREALGWRPEVELRQGLEQTWHWFSRYLL